MADQFGRLHRWEKNNVIPNEYAPEICSILGINIEDQELYTPDWIIELRESLEMKPLSFAALLEVSELTLWRWESGRTKLSEKNTIMLHNLYKNYQVT